MPPFPATHSIPSPGALRELLRMEYPLAAPVGCRLHMSGVNDVYIVESGSGPAILKVYRAGWRSHAEVLYELDLLEHLHGAGLSVNHPILRKNGERIFSVEAVEGSRPSVLFSYAPGKQPTWPFYEDAAESRLLGVTLAAIHNAGDDFASPHPRFRHDAALHIDGALAAARPFLAHRAADWEYLLGLADRLRARLADLAGRELSWGICHGDFHCGNAFITEERRVTVFDFDVCGPGWLAYDLARWRANTEGRSGNSWNAFLEGYQEKRALRAADLEAVPTFVILRTLDWMRIKTTFTASGEFAAWDMEFYCNDTFALLKRWESRATDG